MTNGINKMGLSIAQGAITATLYEAYQNGDRWVPFNTIVKKLENKFCYETLKRPKLAGVAEIRPLGIGHFSLEEALAWGLDDKEVLEKLAKGNDDGFTTKEVTELILMVGVKSELYEEKEVNGVKYYASQLDAKF